MSCQRQPGDAALPSSPYGSGSFLGDNAAGEDTKEEADTVGVDDVRDASEAKSDAEMTASSRKRIYPTKLFSKTGQVQFLCLPP